MNCSVMKLYRTVLVALVSLFIGSSLFAQIIQDPTTWTIEAKKKKDNEYQVIFHLKLKKTWHIWSLKPGGDGLEISPAFTFAPNSNIKLIGTVTEQGKIITSTMDGVD